VAVFDIFPLFRVAIDKFYRLLFALPRPGPSAEDLAMLPLAPGHVPFAAYTDDGR